jgi:hypothetical protein
LEPLERRRTSVGIVEVSIRIFGTDTLNNLIGAEHVTPIFLILCGFHDSQIPLSELKLFWFLYTRQQKHFRCQICI